MNTTFARLVLIGCTFALAACDKLTPASTVVAQKPDFIAFAAQLAAPPEAADEAAAILPQVPQAPPRAEMLRRFWGEDFPWLEARLAQQEAALGSATARTQAAENLNDMVAWITSEPQAFVVAERWQAAVPNSYWAHTVLGAAYLKEGGRARGAEFAAETSSRQFAELERWRERSYAALMAAGKLDKRPYSALAELLLSSLGDATQAERQALADAALRIVPGSAAIYKSVLYGLEPKWGGSIEAMREAIVRARVPGVSEKLVRKMEADTYLAETEGPRRLNQRLAADHYGKAAEISDNSKDWRWYGWALNDAMRQDEAERAFTRALELDPGNLDALKARGDLRRGSGRIEEGFADLRQAAEAGHYPSQDMLIHAYAYGTSGVPRDFEALRPLCEMAAAMGNGSGKFCIGGMYFDGLAAYPRDRKKAVEMYRRGALKGHAVAQHDYGWMLVQGDSVAQDRAEGIKWLRAAARQNMEVAKNKLRGLGEPIEEASERSGGLAAGLHRLLRRIPGWS